jgi:hypothetical protein
VVAREATVHETGQVAVPRAIEYLCWWRASLSVGVVATLTVLCVLVDWVAEMCAVVAEVVVVVVAGGVVLVVVVVVIDVVVDVDVVVL